MIKSKYSFLDKFSLALQVVRSKFISRKIRIIRFPIDLRGKEWIDFGERLTTGRYCRLEAFMQMQNKCKTNAKQMQNLITFGRDVQINDSVHISAMKSVRIGNNVLIASHVYISDNSHGNYKNIGGIGTDPHIPPAKREYHCASVTIEDNVWIGEHVIVMPGVTIGYGSIIGSNSVVTKDIPPLSIAVGSPARIIKVYSREEKRWFKAQS